MNPLEKEILKYEKRGFKIIQKRTLKHGLRVFLKKKFGILAGGGFLGVYIYYVDGECTTDSLRECFKDYVKFYEVEEFGKGDKGFYMCSGSLDEKLFKDLRKAMISDEEIRNNIKTISLGRETTERTANRERPKLKSEKTTREIGEIITTIKKFAIHRMPKNERELDSMLVHYLSAPYPNISTKVAYQNTKIDAQIENVGIEIKYQPSSSEFDRLYGQIDKYLKYLEKIIVVIGYERNRELTETFEKRLKERGWLNNRVFVIATR